MTGEEELLAQHRDAMADLGAAACEWTEARAARSNTDKQAAAIREAEKATRKLEKKIRKIRKNDNNPQRPRRSTP